MGKCPHGEFASQKLVKEFVFFFSRDHFQGHLTSKLKYWWSQDPSCRQSFLQIEGIQNQSVLNDDGLTLTPHPPTDHFGGQ